AKHGAAAKLAGALSVAALGTGVVLEGGGPASHVPAKQRPAEHTLADTRPAATAAAPTRLRAGHPRPQAGKKAPARPAEPLPVRSPAPLRLAVPPPVPVALPEQNVPVGGGLVPAQLPVPDVPEVPALPEALP
ncbi:MAG: hypothetical protein ACRDMU_07095, partial [Gaiellaceae bacterium]